MKKIERLDQGRRSCEFGIALLVGVVNVFYRKQYSCDR